MEAHGRVLLVDEDPVTRLAIDRQLDALGWDALVLGSAKEALGVVEIGVKVPILLTDVKLPDLDGMTLAWKITMLAPRTHVIYIGSALPDAPITPRNAPFLLKPFSLKQGVRFATDGLSVRSSPSVLSPSCP